MLEKFNQMKEMYAFKKQADLLKKQMAAIITTVYHKNWKIVIRGDQTIDSVYENEEERKDLADAFNKAVKESQKATAKKMQGQLGGLGIPGL
jgi:DNA-binding protein YbaB